MRYKESEILSLIYVHFVSQSLKWEINEPVCILAKGEEADLNLEGNLSQVFKDN